MKRVEIYPLTDPPYTGRIRLKMRGRAIVVQVQKEEPHWNGVDRLRQYWVDAASDDIAGYREVEAPIAEVEALRTSRPAEAPAGRSPPE